MFTGTFRYLKQAHKPSGYRSLFFSLKESCSPRVNLSSTHTWHAVGNITSLEFDFQCLSSYMIWYLISLTICFYVHETETVLPNLWGGATGKDTNKYLLVWFFFFVVFCSGISWKHFVHWIIDLLQLCVSSHMFPLSRKQWHKVKTFISGYIANKCQSKVQLMLSYSSMSLTLSLQVEWTMETVHTPQ